MTVGRGCNVSSIETSLPQQVSENLLLCDIVMAGGVTSGIIYPGAVSRIAERYRFHSIGGTSVGAIAAAATAAAEYRRQETGSAEGFKLVERVPHEMTEKAPDGRSRLFHLFTPDGPPARSPADDTRPMMDLLSPLFGQGGPFLKAFKIFRGGLKRPLVAAAFAVAFLIVLPAVLTLVWYGHWAMAFFAGVAALGLALAVATITLVFLLLFRWLPAMARNGFGICSGMSNPAFPAEGRYLGLTPWMHETIQKAAGRSTDDNPLTFGELWTAGKDRGEPQDKPDLTTPRNIELSMMTSDVSRQISAQFPFLEVPTPLYFNASEMRRYFPENVVQWMIDHAGEAIDGVKAGNGDFRLPSPNNLPVLLAARMSLSFPILLSAVPLHAVNFSQGKRKLEEVWYSDGGLTSNFPVHLFDGPIPSRPTFCLNLVGYDTSLDRGDDRDELTSRNRQSTGLSEDRLRPGARVWKYVGMTRRNEERATLMTEFRRSSGGLFGFASALINTARFWSDNQLLAAPGVRDRVVHIGLLNDEGGLNLDMQKRTVVGLDRRGQAAGMLIAARFDPKSETDPKTGQPISHSFPNHRWVRFRNTMGAVEDLARRFGTAFQKSEAAASRREEWSLGEIIERGDQTNIGYPPPPRSKPHFKESLKTLLDMSSWIVEQERGDPMASYDPSGNASNAPRRTMRYTLRPLRDNDPRAERGDPPTGGDSQSSPTSPKTI